jgi:hypothetical protein
MSANASSVDIYNFWNVDFTIQHPKAAFHFQILSSPSNLLYTGRMLNRFSKDFATIDTNLANTLQQVNSSLAALLVSVLTVA